jgi:phosphocarrier protein HPr
MAERQATIASRVGLHARPAKIFIEAVKRQSVPVTIALGDAAPMDASSILTIMALGAANGDVVTLRAEGDGADAALAELAAVLETDHDAE